MNARNKTNMRKGRGDCVELFGGRMKMAPRKKDMF